MTKNKTDCKTKIILLFLPLNMITGQLLTLELIIILTNNRKCTYALKRPKYKFAML